MDRQRTRPGAAIASILLAPALALGCGGEDSTSSGPTTTTTTPAPACATPAFAEGPYSAGRGPLVAGAGRVLFWRNMDRLR